MPIRSISRAASRAGARGLPTGRAPVVVVALVVLAAGMLAVPVASATALSSRPAGKTRAARPSCPWASAHAAATETPEQLAVEVIAHMDLGEKLAMVGLAASGGYENESSAIPALCIPVLRLQDGPDGISYGAHGVTQLPAALGIAASFDPTLAFAYGQVEAEEARAKGVEVIQGPNLNVVRVPNAGRSFEGYGEDPDLISAFGTQEIEGIQSVGVMASAKHYSAYNQETDRPHLDEIVSARALEEIYLPAFAAAVKDAHVASIMCAYGEINGVNACQDKLLFRALGEWGFSGFVRSDLRSVHNPIAAFRDGIDVVKPDASAILAAAVAHHRLSTARLNDAVERILSEMFAFGLITNPRPPTLDAAAASPAHAAFARLAAEDSMVLLKDHDGLLPLAGHHVGSVAVIGADGAGRAITAGSGSSYVIPPFVSTPLSALRQRLGAKIPVSYASGGESFGELTPILYPQLRTIGVASGIVGTPDATRVIPAGDRIALETLRETVVPRRSGLYSLSIHDQNASWLFVDDHLLSESPGPHGPLSWDSPVELHAGERYVFSVVFSDTNGDIPILGWQDDSPAIAAAVAKAKTAHVAVVFVGDPSKEGADRPTIALPGDEDALIAAVAAVNPRTVVVVNSGGAILMPWLHAVGAVLEAWFPGEEDGTATSAVLTGAVDPAGHLPVTFPASAGETPAASDATFPGIGGVVKYSEGLDVGYRYFEAHHLRPLFSFGFGLSYTKFALSGLKVSVGAAGDTASIDVKNVGHRAGTEVVQAYLTYPQSAGEPPNQLKAFATIALKAGASGVVNLGIPASGFECYFAHAWRILPGTYRLALGDSSSDLHAFAAVPAPTLPVSSAPPAPAEPTPTTIPPASLSLNVPPLRTPIHTH